jgi:hypothetical protein
VKAASQRFHCEAKTLYNMIHRRGYTHYGKDLLSLRQICSHLGVRYSKVTSWIEQNSTSPAISSDGVRGCGEEALILTRVYAGGLVSE